MANDYIPHPDARLHAWQNNFVAHVHGPLADSTLAAGAMRAEIWVKVGDPPPTPSPPGWPPQKTRCSEEERIQ